MRFVAHARHDLFNAPAFVAHDLSFSGPKIHRTTHRTRGQQRLVHVLQIHQVSHALFAFGRFRPTCVGQNRRHFGVSKTSMAVHHCRVKLVSVHIALGIDQHVAHHAQTVHIRVQ